jgi:hypothetical protein
MKLIVENAPKFATEQEEAEWWDANPDLVVELFQRAETARNGTSSSATRIRLNANDIAQAKDPTDIKISSPSTKVA